MSRLVGTGMELEPSARTASALILTLVPFLQPPHVLLWCHISLYDVSAFAMSFLFPLQFDLRWFFEVGVKPKFFLRENEKASANTLGYIIPRPLGTKLSTKSPKQAVQAASGHNHKRPGL